LISETIGWKRFSLRALGSPSSSLSMDRGRPIG